MASSTPRDYPLRSELRRLATQLRNSLHRRMPLEAVEQAQHHIVRLEEAVQIWPSELDVAARSYLDVRAFLIEAATKWPAPKPVSAKKHDPIG